MKSKTLSMLISAGIVVAVSIPMVIAKFNTHSSELTVIETVEQNPEAVDKTPMFEVETFLSWEEIASIHEAMLEEVTTELIEETIEETTEVEKYPPFKSYDSIPLDAEFQGEIFELCKAYEIDYTFVMGWMWTESRCRWVIGDSNDTGYMQVIPKFWEGYMGIDLYDPLGNVEMGLAILTKCLNDNNGDLYNALQQYNTGFGYTRNGYADLVFQNVEMIREWEGL